VHKENALQNSLRYNFVQPSFLKFRVKIPFTMTLFLRKFSNNKIIFDRLKLGGTVSCPSYCRPLPLVGKMPFDGYMGNKK